MYIIKARTRSSGVFNRNVFIRIVFLHGSLADICHWHSQIWAVSIIGSSPLQHTANVQETTLKISILIFGKS